MHGDSWILANRRRLDALFAALAAALSGAEAAEPPAPGPASASRIDSLADIFGLGASDMMVLLVAAAQDIEPAALGGRRATVGVACAIAGEGARAALCPQAPLRRWRLVEIEGPGALPDRILRLDERILHHLLGIDYLDARLEGLVAYDQADPGGSERALAASLAPLRQDGAGGWPVLQLCGPGFDARRGVAAALAASNGQRLFRIARQDIPRAAYERLVLARLCDRELALSDGLMLVEGEDGGGEDQRIAADFVDSLLGPTIVLSRDALPLRRRRRQRVDLPEMTALERRMLWADLLGDEAAQMGSQLDRLSEQFRLDGAGIRASIDLAGQPPPGGGDRLADRLWSAARGQSRARLDDLAERIEGRVGWDDLVLPADRIRQLRDIAVHVRRAHQVNNEWGWAARGERGLGVAALFAGPSGTGKTMAAEVLGAELGLDLYRIDLSRIVSKYIGETEKNLRRIFEAAETSGALLLFDEADALFGKRSEVKDSHDRYANIEISYLLQRMEAYRGLAVLTTNLKSTLDDAFMRRLRFIVDFPFPDAALRREIWQRVFPPGTPVEGLDAERLSRLVVAGGTIRTIAINAAFMAAERETAVEQPLIMAAARQEYAKLEKSATAAEFGNSA
jgi:vesicle-fusing ATPase